MCIPASFVLTKDHIFFSKISNNHENIIRENNLTVDGLRGPNIVRVEIVPTNDDYTLPLEYWIYAVDQNILPDWYDEKRDQQRTKYCLKNEWNKYHCCSQYNLLINAQQIGGFQISQTAGDKSIQTAHDGSTQTAGWYSTQTANLNSTQIAGDYSIQIASNNSTQVAGNYSTQTTGYYSVQITGNNCKQKAGIETTQITKWFDSNKKIWKMATRIVTEKEADKWYQTENGKWKILHNTPQ